MKIFEMPVEKISHSPAYLEADASHEHLKRKGDLNEEEKREKKKLEDEMKEEIATEERLQKEAAVVANRSGMEVSYIYFISTDFFRSGLMKIK